MKRFLVGVAIFCVVLIAGATGIFFGIGYYLSPQDKLEKVDVIVAISGGDTKARTSEAVNLYKQGYAEKLIFSGAALDPSGPSNALAMARDAQSAGVPASSIDLDEAAENTRQNAAGVAQIVEQEAYKSIILVTSPYHQRRADITFQRALGPNVKIINHSSVDQDWRRAKWWDTSTSRNLTFEELQKVGYEVVSGTSK